MATKNGSKKKPTARSTSRRVTTTEVESVTKAVAKAKEEITSTRRRTTSPSPASDSEKIYKGDESNGDDEPKRKYVGVLSLWCNEVWADIQQERNLEPDDAGMAGSIRPTEAQILIDELQLGIDEKRNTKLYLMANLYKDKESHPDFKISILVDPDYAQQCYDKIKTGSLRVGQPRRGKTGGGSTRRYR